MAEETIIEIPDSILDDIKKLLGPSIAMTQFDIDIIIHINTALSILTDLGVGPKTGFAIRDRTAVWSDFIPENMGLEIIKTYVFMKVKLIFDPPLNASVLSAMNESVKEYEWRIEVKVGDKEV